jgi:DNA-binding NarL/FixJ family response regulator
VRVVIADDSGLLRDGLTRLLAETGTEVVAAVGDATDLIATVDAHRPDLAVIDIRMPPTYTHEGARAAVELRERHPELGILLLSQSLERAHPQRFGYLLKDRVVDVDVLVQAMHTILAGGTVLDPAVVSHLMGSTGLADELDRLSTREREVLELMAQGRSNAAIAADLIIDLRTVESHIARIMTKLELHPTADEHRRVLAVLAWLRS